MNQVTLIREKYLQYIKLAQVSVNKSGLLVNPLNSPDGIQVKLAGQRLVYLGVFEAGRWEAVFADETHHQNVTTQENWLWTFDVDLKDSSNGKIPQRFDDLRNSSKTGRKDFFTLTNF